MTGVQTCALPIYIIREERRKELALEGHRWFDLRRYRVCQKYPYSTELKRYYYIYSDRSSTDVVECRLFTLEKDDKAYTLNIPQEVLDYNYEMENNERPFRTYQTVDF